MKCKKIREKKKKFSLLELMVVITIILILAALLLPMLHRAKMKSQNVLCVSHLRQSAMGILAYAKDNASYYPRRSVDKSYWPARPLLRYIERGGKTSDDRSMIRPYMPDWRVMNCAFTIVTDEEIESSMAGSVKLSYEMYFGSYMNREGRTNKAKTALFRLDDVMQFKGYEFSTLMTDIDFRKTEDSSNPYHITSHPTYGEPSPNLYKKIRDGGYVSHYFISKPYRGDIDRNFLRSDGSVYGLKNLEFEDDRLVEVGYVSKKRGRKYSKNHFSYLPPDD